MTRATRPISWIKAARKDFEKFPRGAQDICLDALSITADGGRADISKPMTGLGSGIWEIAVTNRRNAFRVVYALQLGDELWVLHAFQKKSKKGIATPKPDIDLIKERIKRLKEALK